MNFGGEGKRVSGNPSDDMSQGFHASLVNQYIMQKNMTGSRLKLESFNLQATPTAACCSQARLEQSPHQGNYGSHLPSNIIGPMSKVNTHVISFIFSLLHRITQNGIKSETFYFTFTSHSPTFR